MALPVVVVTSGGLPVQLSLTAFGMPVEFSSLPGALPVRIVTTGGVPCLDPLGNVFTPAFSLTAPENFTWVSDVDDNTPLTQATFTDLRVDDVGRLRVATDVNFVSFTDYTNTAEQIEVDVLTLQFTTGALADGQYWMKTRHEPGPLQPPGTTESDWSNVETKTIAASFDPLSLFSGGFTGVWIDPSDLVNMDQTTTLGTTAVTADGDPIGYIGDKSGNGFHLTQATAGSKPTYKTSGGLHWLEFDGTADHIFRAADIGAFDSAGGCSVWFAYYGTPGNDKVFCGADNTGGTAPRYDFLTSNTGKQSFYGRNGSSTDFNAIQDLGTFSNNTATVFGAIDDKTGITGRLNGVAGTRRADTNTRTASTFNCFTVGALKRSSVAGYLPGRIYGLLLINKQLDASEIASLNTWMGNKIGVSI